MPPTIETEARRQIAVEDVEYQRQGGRPLLARLYRPSGAGPFPAALQIHGGAWVAKDRTDNDYIAKALAESGILVVSIDFRMPPEAPYPASLADINLATRWLKARAQSLGSRPDWVGAFGTSSGGHQVLLAAMRPDDPRYRALPLAEAPDLDARLAFVISGWGVLYPLERQKLAKAAGDDKLARSHDIFFGNEEGQIEATPALAIERGEKVYLPPALVFQGTKDKWTSVELAQRFAADYRKAGGEMDLLLLEGAQHTFLNEHPFDPNSVKALNAVIAFIKQHGAERHAQR